MQSANKWLKSGEPWIWLNAGAVAISMTVVLALLAFILVRGLGHFWAADIYEISYVNDDKAVRLFGEVIKKENINRVKRGLPLAADGDEFLQRWSLKTGNRELWADFRWIDEPSIQSVSLPDDLVVLERTEWGAFYGYLRSVSEGGTLVAEGDASWKEFISRVERVSELRNEIRGLQRGDMGSVNYQMEQLRLKGRALELKGTDTPVALAQLADKKAKLQSEFGILMARLTKLNDKVERDTAKFEVMDGRVVDIALADIIEGLKPNSMSVWQKSVHYVYAFWGFMMDDPREANTEGGVFPAIFGTVLMVLLMSILVTPFGVISAVYLKEYATQGLITRIVRIAVNNLAGVPSIVYGVFGLGFFVYFLGGSLDQLFYPEAAPAPHFGTPGLMWASFTLALLTLPVVIVSTEEGLSRIPRNLREGSLALGATNAETLWKVVLPMASPSIMTGLILAVARAAGEVAPLMLVGVVKLAPELPLDGNFPFLHMERKFMHLGFHIYDVGFQSPNVEAAQPLVYATAFLLVLIIVVLNLSAIVMRNNLREKYRGIAG